MQGMTATAVSRSLSSLEEDARFLAAWQHGDARAGAALYARHSVMLVQYFRRHVPPGDVEDLMQETFLRCQRTHYRGEGSVRAFLYGVAYWLRREHWRSCNRHVVASSDELFERACAEFEDDPEYVLCQAQELRTLMKALRRIPHKYQVVLEKRCWCGLTQREIAGLLNKPEPTIRRWAQEALDALEVKLGELSTSRELRDSTTMTLASWRASVRKLELV